MSKQLHEMSDEELMALSPTQIAELTASESAEQTSTEEAEPVQETPAAATSEVPAGEVEDEGHEETNAAANSAEAGQGVDAEAAASQEGEPAAQTAANTKPTDAAPADKPADAKPADAGNAPDAAALKSFHERITAPFKANGRDMQVQNAEEAIQLMQMGANYNHKMRAMKPHLATLRMLENAGIKDTDLNFLIDVHRKDPAAINKLVKDSGIDPLDLSADKAAGYTPGNHAPHEAEVALDIVIRDLDGSPGLPKVMDVVANHWDAKSKQVIAQNPDVIRGLTHHVEAGWFDQVMAKVDRERALGNLNGLSDLDAYSKVGDAMAASGAFAQKEAGQPSRQQTPTAPAIVEPSPKQAEDSNRNEKRRSAAPARSAPATAVAPDFNPLSMSDEEFMQKFSKKF